MWANSIATTSNAMDGGANTGDLGVINRWGAVRLVDREIDRIPDDSAIELEDVLDRLPDTTEVVILAVAGEKPIPVLSMASDRPLDRQAWAKRSLTR